MNKKIIALIVIVFVILTCVMAFYNIRVDNKPTDNNDTKTEDKIDKDGDKVKNIRIRVNNEVLDVKLENNSSSDALVERLKQEDIIIEAHDYGNFEKVGDLGFSLPTNDVRITTKPGDLILYQGNQITLYYDTNTWSLTKLGEVVGKSQNELKNVLGSGNVTLVLSLN